MRGFWLASVLTMAALLPTVGKAEPGQNQTPPPPVSAEYEAWQFNDEPIIVNGLIYYPTRRSRFFDGNVMMQVGVYRRVPVYADATLEPHSVIYLPIGRQTMRAYERAGDAGAVGTAGLLVPVPARDDATRPPAPGYAAPSTDVPRPAVTRIESIPRPPRGRDGIWIEFAGERWYSDGPASVFDEERFLQVGTYRGFPVYRDKNRGAEEIWVRTVAGGAVAPYAKR